MLDTRLRYLAAVARAGSFTAAAHRVGVTQSAITKSVADLEREIGYSIFHRTARGVILTEKGGEFVTRVTRLLEDAQELLKGGTNSNPYSGILRIGVCPASLEWWLVSPLLELFRKYRGIRYEISGANFETIVNHLRSGSIDVAIGFEAAFSEWPDLRRESMGALETKLFVRRDHPLLELRTLTLRDLADYDFVSPSESRPYGEVIRDLFESQGIDWHHRVHRADFFPIVRGLVENSDAIGVVALSYADSEHFGQQFSLLPDIGLFPVAPLCCAVRARWEPKPATRALIGVIKQSFPLRP